MNPRFEARPALTVVGYQIDTKPMSPEIGELWGKFGSAHDVQWPPSIGGGGAYGVMQYHEDTGVLTYMAGIPVAPDAQVPEGMHKWDVPETEYAIFSTVLDNLAETFTKIYNEWLPNADVDGGTGPALEWYGPGFHEKHLDVNVLIPIRRR
ncbi:MAG: GyrI-like domain-containing protein [Planctomycetota bacterium]